MWLKEDATEGLREAHLYTISILSILYLTSRRRPSRRPTSVTCIGTGVGKEARVNNDIQTSFALSAEHMRSSRQFPHVSSYLSEASVNLEKAGLTSGVVPRLRKRFAIILIVVIKQQEFIFSVCTGTVKREAVGQANLTQV